MRTANDYYVAATSLKMLCKEGYINHSHNSIYNNNSSYNHGNYNNSYINIMHEGNNNNIIGSNNNDGVGESLLKSFNVSEVSPFVYLQQQGTTNDSSTEFGTISNKSLLPTLALSKDSMLMYTSENTSDSDPFIYNPNNIFASRNSNSNSNNNSGYTSPSSTLYNALLSACQSPSWLDSNFQDDKPL